MTPITTETKRNLWLGGLKLFDLSLMLVSFGLATVFVFSGHSASTFAEFLAMRVKLVNFVLLSAAAVSWHVIFALTGMYGSKRLSTRRAVIQDALRATTISAMSLALVCSVFAIKMGTPKFLAFFWVIAFVLISLGRLLVQYVLSRARLRGHNLRHMLILGTNRRAIEFARFASMRPELGYRVLGFVDEEWQAVLASSDLGLPLVADLKTLPEYLRHNIVDEVANYLPLRTFYGYASEVAALCELHGIILRYDSDIFGLKMGRSHSEALTAEHHHITCYPGRLRGWPVLAKRVFDFMGALVLLLLLSPLLLAVALLQKITSQGPIFFYQERIGYNKRRFRIYKFRTMVAGAEKMLSQLQEFNEVSGPVFKIRNDPRITPIGKLLRRSSIDELPQLLNVLKGDMSLVGPRPLPVRDYHGFNEDWQRRRFSVRPGITCLWQVNGRSSITFDQWMKLDLQYMDEWSLWLDLKILARTIPAVLRGSGAH